MSSLQLTATALAGIKGCGRNFKNDIALDLRCSEGSINRYLRENNPALTCASVLILLKKKTGIPFKKMLEPRPLVVPRLNNAPREEEAPS